MQSHDIESDKHQNIKASTEYSIFLLGASGSDQETTAVCSAGNPTITLSETKDFINGQMVSLEHAGPAASIPTPNNLSVSAIGLNRQGPTGNTVYAYRVAAISENGEISAASSAVAINNGHAQLGTITSNIRGLAFNVVRWDTTAPGAAVWRSRAGSDFELRRRLIN
ncbi:hypothetical protein [Brucella pituitosa]|uniref:hypothetical protein n=1 Tax=Brucella pituitosa TaxID=571256 RepID=UPI00126019D0|nr:hypothetical protein [Brucella pituitosa]